MKRNKKATCGDNCPYWKLAVHSKARGNIGTLGFCCRSPQIIGKDKDEWCGEHPDFSAGSIHTEAQVWTQFAAAALCGDWANPDPGAGSSTSGYAETADLMLKKWRSQYGKATKEQEKERKQGPR